MTKKNHGLRSVSPWTYVMLIVISVIFLAPIAWIVLSSFKSSAEIFRFPPTLFPKSFSIQNYVNAFSEGNFVRYFANTTFVTVVSTILCVVISLMAGYVFAKYNFKGNNALFILFVSTLMLPLEVQMIPTFLMIKKFGLYNSFWGLIIPPAATPAGIFLVRQYFLSVPNELMQAARIDGASETQIFLRIMLPIAKPVTTSIAVFSVLWRWNDYMWPLLVIRDPSKYTVQLALANFAGQYSIDWEMLLAMSVVTMIPMLIVFLVFQKSFIKGMTTSGLKE